MSAPIQPHLEILAAICAAGFLASWNRGQQGRVFDMEAIADDALSLAEEIMNKSYLHLPSDRLSE